MRPGAYSSPHGAINSPMLAHHHLRGTSTISPPPVPAAAGMGSAEWPTAGVISPTPHSVYGAYRETSAPRSSMHREASYPGVHSPSAVEGVEGYEATVMADLQARCRDAETRERALAAQLAKERQKHQAIVTAFLTALRTICKKTDIPEEVPSPGRASILSVQVKAELMQNDMDKELAMASAQAASSKIEELVDAMKEKDLTMMGLEERIALLADQVKILQTSPVRGEGRQDDADEDPSLMDGLTADGKTMFPYAHVQSPPPQSGRRHITTPQQPLGSNGTSPARSPVPASNPRSAAKEWPPSPRRVHAADAAQPVIKKSPKPASARKEWPPSPRRTYTEEPAAEPERKEWPPSPRRELAARSPQREWANETATPDTAPHFEQVVVTSPESSGQGSLQRTHEGMPMNGLAVPKAGYDEGVSPRRERCFSGEPAEAAQAETTGPQEWPPSPQRTRGAPPLQGEEEVVDAPKEWPPSPARNRGAPAVEAEPETSYTDLLGQQQDSNDAELLISSPPNVVSPLAQTLPAATRDEGVKEFPPSPQRQRPQGANEPETWHPSPTRARVQMQEEQTYASRTPNRAGATPASAKSSNPRSAAKSWPKSPRREVVEEPPRTPEIVLAAGPAPGATPTCEQPLGPKTLEWPATGSPNCSTALERADMSEPGLERKRSVGFIHVPEDQDRESTHHSSARRASGSDVGLARRSVDMIRDVHVGDSVTPTARMKILQLERELEKLRESTQECGVLDESLQERAVMIFKEISSVCQEDGRISKAKLGHILREERLGAAILFHELDSNENGEVNMEEWMNWFGHLQRREAAVNMLEWLEERFRKATTEEKAVAFDPSIEIAGSPALQTEGASDDEDGTTGLSEELSLRITTAYHALDHRAGDSSTVPSVKLAEVMGLEQMAAAVLFKDLYAIAEDGQITMENWVEWFIRLADVHHQAEEMAAFVEQRVALPSAA